MGGRQVGTDTEIECLQTNGACALASGLTLFLEERDVNRLNRRRLRQIRLVTAVVRGTINSNGIFLCNCGNLQLRTAMYANGGGCKKQQHGEWVGYITHKTFCMHGYCCRLVVANCRAKTKYYSGNPGSLDVLGRASKSRAPAWSTLTLGVSCSRRA